MRPLIGILLTASLAVGFLLVPNSAVYAQTPQFRMNEEVVVTTPATGVKAKGSLGDHLLTFNVPVEVPGAALAPGTYLFSRPMVNNPNILQVTSTDRRHAYATFFTVPLIARDITDRDRIMFGEPMVAGAPIPIKRWYVAGERFGYELLYRKEAGRAMERAAD
jgi:hypothetical protein